VPDGELRDGLAFLGKFGPALSLQQLEAQSEGNYENSNFYDRFS